MGTLAIKGGTPTRREPFLEWPQLNMQQGELLMQAYNSGIWGIGGKNIKSLAEKMNSMLNVGYGFAVSNGTVALEIALRALEIGFGDEVVVPDYTFISTASSVIMVGAKPVFCDVDLGTFNIDPASIEQSITDKTKAIIVVHVGGMACDMEVICRIAKKHNVFVIEDCAHAIGSYYGDKALGTIGDIGTFSFQSSKLVTSGEGGYICTHNYKLYKRMWALTNCGRDVENMQWYNHPYIGTNARISEFQACILNSQLDKLEELLERIRLNVSLLDEFFQASKLIHLRKYGNHQTNYYIYGGLYNGYEEYGVKRRLFIHALRAEGIPVSEGYKSLVRQKCFKNYGNDNIKGCENSYLLETKKAIWFDFNLFIGTKKDVEDIIRAISKIENNICELQKFSKSFD